ncbi:hypothetical protein FB192DRAFT_1455665 [Mucor lusitanicus]|uniref:WW domain-containing protein n=1 Tax=Mucor circinelloides f. lusitanicus TaxID=29924 RepID=A0A8H4BNU9_MUCCL|nr:hypothetical protein FB192DRAFT_1455665 [Mucor lusitanicus]
MSESKQHTPQEDVIDSKQQEKEPIEATQDESEQQQPTWTPVWDDNAQAYYWWNTETNETTWINPDASPEEVAAAQAQAKAAAAAATTANSNPLDFLLDRIDNVVKKKLDGLDGSTASAVDDDDENAAYYDNSNNYATTYDAYATAADPSASSSSADLYTSQAHFNARTGRFTTQADVNRLNPEMLSIEARAKRQMQNYFDVDSYTEQRNAQIHNAENGRINKKKPLTLPKDTDCLKPGSAKSSEFNPRYFVFQAVLDAGNSAK